MVGYMEYNLIIKVYLESFENVNIIDGLQSAWPQMINPFDTIIYLDKMCYSYTHKIQDHNQL